MRNRVLLALSIVLLVIVLTLSIVNGEDDGWQFLAQSGFGLFGGGVVGALGGMLLFVLSRERIERNLPPTAHTLLHEQQAELHRLRNRVGGKPAPVAEPPVIKRYDFIPLELPR